MRRLILSCAAAFALVACSGEPEQPVPYAPMDGAEEGAWAAFRMDPARTGFNPAAQTGTTSTELWRYEDINVTDYGAAKSSPSVADGTVFIGSDDAMFRAFDAMSGEIVWETELEETSHGIHGSAAIGADYVYIGGYNGILYAFDRETGDEIWRYKKGFQVGASPVLVPEHGRVYNTHERSSKGGGHVVSVDAMTGDEIWSYDIRAHPHSSVALDVEDDLLFVGDNLAIIHAFDARNGEKLWDYQLEQTREDQSDIKTTPTVIAEKDIVVVGAWSEKVHAFDAHSGELLWEYDVGASIMGSTAYAPGREVVYVGSLSPDRSLHAIDVNTGERVWRTEVGSVMSSPAINGDESLVVLGASTQRVHAFDAETGDEVWSHDVGGSVTGSPALVGTRVYITAYQGDLLAVETNPDE